MLAIGNTKNKQLAEIAYSKSKSYVYTRYKNLAKYNTPHILALKNIKAIGNEKVPSIVEDSYLSSNELVPLLEKRKYSKEVLDKLNSSERPYAGEFTDKDNQDLSYARKLLNDGRYYATDRVAYQRLAGKKNASERSYRNLTRRIERYKSEDNETLLNKALLEKKYADLYRDNLLHEEPFKQD